MIARWRANRRKRRECEVLGALVQHPDGAPNLTIAATCGRPYAALYAILIRLERGGLVTSRWADGPFPRRRIYSLAERAQ